MKILLPIALVATAAALSACGSTNTKGSWACSAETGTSCAPISAIDNSAPRRGAPGTASSATGIEGAGPVRWWAPDPFVFSSDQGGVRREGDQVIRIVFAPWVDAQGDLHHRSEVMAVMRRGGWWMPAPSTATASAQIDRLGRNALEK
ncbi:TraV family lipoprotein (plasmid) [Brevundimonas nasdae]|uniref:TraV family lipoprotein n=1 Tax=Brevundimonas nasdae TaxID=172043 RepID=A0ABX8TPT9_9CAUL|nr:TraV family lipoprotein [Brevundimonas nasdae]QYC12373.1 TraV family lipoprotein [Brevundimonas nasdae]